MAKSVLVVLALNAALLCAALWVRVAVVPLAAVSLAAAFVALFLTEPRPRSPLDSSKQLAKAPPPDPTPNYELKERLAAGSMGEVWSARHRTLGRDVALKRIKPGEIETEDRQRFEREAHVLSRLTSPHTVEIFDFGVGPSGELFYAMELLDGINLQAAVREWGAMPAERVAYVLIQACASLKEAHDQGLVHRDVKPANFMVCRYGGEYDFVKILDFGLVKQPAGASADPSITRPAAVLGTAAYLAPESVKGSKFVDARADIYALGAVGFWLLTARLLFDVDRPMAMVKAHVSEAPPRASQHAKFAVPQALDELLLECLEKQPGARPQSAGDVRRRLEAIAFAQPWNQDRAAAWWTEHAAARPSA